MVNDELRGIVTRMVEGGESEQDIAAVIQRYKQTRPQPTPEPDEKSLGGFLSNIASSGGKFLGDTVSALTSPVETAKNLGRLGLGAVEKLIPGEQGHERYAEAVGQHFADRYGGLSNIGETLYNDPVGVAADVSTLFGGGAGAAKIASLANVPGAVRATGTLRRIEQATNPTRAITAPVGAGLREIGIGAVRGTVRPPANVRNDFGGSRQIAKTILDERLTSAKGADAKTTAAREAVDAALAEAEQAGVPGVSPRRIIAGLRPAREAARQDVALGLPDQTPALAERARRIRQAATEPGTPGTPGTPAIPEGPPVRVETTGLPDSVDAAILAQRQLGGTQASLLPSFMLGGDPALTRAAQQIGPMADLVPRRLLGESAAPGSVLEFPGTPEVPAVPGTPGTPARVKRIPLTRANALKRRAQDLAFEAKGQGLTTKAKGEEGIATALREAIEEAVPEQFGDIGAMNARTQNLLGATKALEAASDRPKGLANLASIGFGGMTGLASGDPLSALLMALGVQAVDSPRFGTGLGISANELSNILRSKILQEMALGGRAGAIAGEK